MNLIVANFGNDSLGLIQYAKQLGLKDVFVASVETGFGHSAWEQRVLQVKEWVGQIGFNWIRLQARLNFIELVKAQGEFPSTRFQWCATYLKGDTLRAWLDKVDPLKEASVLLARRRSQSVRFQDLPEFVEDAEEFSERQIWHPLIYFNERELQVLIENTPFARIEHRSLECDPCVNSDAADVLRLPDNLIARISALEKQMQEPFLPHLCHGAETLEAALVYLKLEQKQPGRKFLFDMGCGSPYGCGL